MTDPSTFPTLHLWVSYGEPAAPVARLVVHICAHCRAVVSDLDSHLAWHEAVMRSIISTRRADS